MEWAWVCRYKGGLEELGYGVEGVEGAGEGEAFEGGEGGAEVGQLGKVAGGVWHGLQRVYEGVVCQGGVEQAGVMGVVGDAAYGYGVEFWGRAGRAGAAEGHGQGWWAWRG